VARYCRRPAPAATLRSEYSVYVVIVLALASELFAMFRQLPFQSVSGLLSYLPAKLWPHHREAFQIGTFLLLAAVLLAWGYGPMTSQSGLERQVRILKIQVHELELDRVQKDSKIVILQHEVDELERHRERLVSDVISYTRRHSVTAPPASACTGGARQSPLCAEFGLALSAQSSGNRPASQPVSTLSR